MARATIKKEDAVKIRMYLLLVSGIIDFEQGNWYIDTPDDYLIFHSVGSMMDNINYNLECMKEMYEMQNEMSEWNDLWKQAEESKFHFGTQSDRMDGEQYAE